MIRSVEFDLHTRSPLNGSQGISQGARIAFKRYKDDQRIKVRAELQSAWGAPPSVYYRDPVSGLTKRNAWHVTLTRIAIGVMDPGALGGAFKAIQDELAAWCGQKDERLPPWASWRYEQAKPCKGYYGETWQHVYRVRIEVTDLAPGDPRIVVRAEAESHGRAAKSRVKREVSKIERANKANERVVKNVQSGWLRSNAYHPEAGARAASSAARSKAEQGFAKLTGKPTALDLRDAAERVLTVRPTNPDRMPHDQAFERMAKGLPSYVSMRDPGEERPARDLAACTTCGAEVGEPCKPIPNTTLWFGVHTPRAVAAGLVVTCTIQPPKAPTNGTRRIVQAPLPMPPAYVRLGWLGKPCDAGCEDGVLSVYEPVTEIGPRPQTCERCAGTGKMGAILRDARHDGDGPERVTYTVPAEHRARFGDRVTLTRRRTTLPKIGDVWLYE